MNVLYNLKWEDGSGYSPGQVVANAGALFNGGIAVNEDRYLGQIWGSESAIETAIQNCGEYNMVGITDAEAEQFIRDSQAEPTIQERLEATELLIGIIGDE
jgi:hypothetical protein